MKHKGKAFGKEFETNGRRPDHFDAQRKFPGLVQPSKKQKAKSRKVKHKGRRDY